MFLSCLQSKYESAYYLRAFQITYSLFFWLHRKISDFYGKGFGSPCKHSLGHTSYQLGSPLNLHYHREGGSNYSCLWDFLQTDQLADQTSDFNHMSVLVLVKKRLFDLSGTGRQQRYNDPLLFKKNRIFFTTKHQRGKWPDRFLFSLLILFSRYHDFKLLEFS